MTAGTFNPKHDAGAVTTRPTHVPQGASARRWFSDSLNTIINDQDLNLILAQFYAAMDYYGIADSEGSDNALRETIKSALSTQEETIASAATTDLGTATQHRVVITGTATITSFGTKANQLRFLRFTGAAVLTHNATSLICPGAVNITAAAGDTAIVGSDGSGNWRVREYLRADGGGVSAPLPLVRGGTGQGTAVAAFDALMATAQVIASAATTDLSTVAGRLVQITGTTTITSFGTAPAGTERLLWFTGELSVTYNATSMILPDARDWGSQVNAVARILSLGSGNWQMLNYYQPNPLGQADIFTGNGTWTKKPWARYVTIILRGGGGGGGAGRRGAAASARSGGQGGFAAGATAIPTEAKNLPATVAVTIGANGTGGAVQTVNDTNGANGTDGGDTTFGTYARARGGLGGLGGTNAATAVQTTTHTTGLGPPLATSVTAALGNSTSPGAGGSGGSVSTGNAALAGANGGPTIGIDPGGLAQGTLGATATNGVVGGSLSTDFTTLVTTKYSTSAFNISLGAGGGGGGASTDGVTVAGNGGNASGYGAGGGGGGASTNGSNSGKGGDGTPGWAMIIQQP